ncbi:unnamed protein product [Ectocarpus sp. 12 AP-2014]
MAVVASPLFWSYLQRGAQENILPACLIALASLDARGYLAEGLGLAADESRLRSCVLRHRRFFCANEIFRSYDYAAGRNLNIIQTQSGEEDGPLFDNERANGTTYYYHPAKAKSKYCNVIDFGVGIIRPDWLEGATYLGEEECGIYQCHKWEQGEIPEAHARFLGLRTPDEDVRPSKTAVADLAQENSRIIPSQVQSFLTAAAEGAGVVGQGVSREEGGVLLRGGDAGSGGSKGRQGNRFITYWSEKGTDRPVKWLFFNDALFQASR